MQTISETFLKKLCFSLDVSRCIIDSACKFLASHLLCKFHYIYFKNKVAIRTASLKMPILNFLEIFMKMSKTHLSIFKSRNKRVRICESLNAIELKVLKLWTFENVSFHTLPCI